MSSIQLRPYQQQFINDVRNSFKASNKCLAVLPCGAGKTVCFAYMAEQHIKKYPNGCVWFLVHRKELMDQTIATFKRFGIDTSDKIKVGMVQTMANQIKKEKPLDAPTLIIQDECHHASSNTYLTITNKYPNVPLIGLTATPCRLDGKSLGNIFKSLVIGVESDFLINNGYLCHYKYFAPRIAQNEPKMKGFDYDVNSILYEHKIYGDVEKYIDPNKKTIIYCPNIEFSKQLCERINNNLNINAVHFDGNTPKKLRDEIVSNFRNNKIKILSNVDLIGEGFDVPDCDCVIMLRPTMSVALYIQQAMRCLRPAPNKLATIYDFVGNVFRHGMPTEHREWTLDKQVKCRNPSSSPDVLVRECKNCFRVYRGSDRICPYCGYDNGKTKKQLEEDKQAELQEIQSYIKKSNRMQVGMAKSRSELEKIAAERGYNKKWVYVQCKLKGIPY